MRLSRLRIQGALANRSNQGWMIRKAEIVVTAKGEVFLSGKGDLLRLRTVQHEALAV